MKRSSYARDEQVEAAFLCAAPLPSAYGKDGTRSRPKCVVFGRRGGRTFGEPLEEVSSSRSKKVFRTTSFGRASCSIRSWMFTAVGCELGKNHEISEWKML